MRRPVAPAPRATLAAATIHTAAPSSSATIVPVADQTPTVPLDQQLDEIGAQLAWVRDYL
jgi:hypothetical protein